MKERIETEPHSLTNNKSVGIEFGHERFFSIPDLGQSSAAMNFPFTKYSAAVSVSSLCLDSVYSDVVISPAFAMKVKRFNWGVSSKLALKDAGGEPFFENSISISAALDISNDWQLYAAPPSIEFETEIIYLRSEWTAGANIRYQPLAMVIGAAIYQNVNEVYGLRISQYWRAGSMIAFYGSFESDPLKISLGFSCFYRRLSAGVKFDRYPSIGSVQHYYTGYGSTTP
ncbi:MAG: hypothetical protein JNL74_19655 [Fibrobacteres bacterium]|nr:hypothetical protein [Fibrobacterota bacterium]